MRSMYMLVMNEVIKMLRKKRLWVVVLILLVLVPIFTYAQLRVAVNNQKQLGTSDWKVALRQQINDTTNRLSSTRVPEEWKQWMRIRVEQQQYYLNHNIDPNSPNAVTFTRDFMSNAVSLFIPLLIVIVAADIVSGEHTSGTIKVLLTRPVRRWKILTSKLIALVLFVSAIVVLTGGIAYGISGLVFGYGGWTYPVLTGFQIRGSNVNTDYVHVLPQWLYILMEYGLAWYACLAVACLSLMVSVLVRSTAAGMGIMVAALIAGTILTNMASTWESAKYFFMVNLQITDYLSGMLPPIPGMSLSFSLMVLGVWSAVALVIAYSAFTQRDVLN
ncbi:ABC-2 type transport system permease protein [Aneurinibacillus soli]|uniref:ABC-2 family transporter protein n=1 Tax=Aneurinibacillus soli TaxID=1500254 RepID=A0A0U5B3H7_9BACL|nr:ABC transporter permease [Aneurinibacillus soli]PYE59468.1 ABC-2 type transport system permease protein [Aneurinibacillus soli]BAU29202.1 ABC-2 family transporter protein [Aneurinibacillus soli]